MEVRTYTVYKFDELTTEQQAQAIEHYRGINVDHDKWHEFVLEDWKARLEAMGFIDPEINYSGFWSQGDGASFTAKSIDLATYIKSQKLGNKYRMVLSHADNLGGEVRRNTHHYYHENTVTTELDESGMGYTVDDMPVTKRDKFNWQLNQLEIHISQHVVGLCKQIYRELEAEYDYLTSDEAVKDTLIANDYDFTTDGRIA